jgi:hypothetical protein
MSERPGIGLKSSCLSRASRRIFEKVKFFFLFAVDGAVAAFYSSHLLNIIIVELAERMTCSCPLPGTAPPCALPNNLRGGDSFLFVVSTVLALQNCAYFFGLLAIQVLNRPF